jgi:2-iminobutanoate/2-iminopropanoate deaminase
VIVPEKEVIHTDKAPPIRQGRAQAIRYGDLVFLSGQVPRDANDHYETGDIQSQARLVFQNLKAVLEAAGSSFDDVLKMQIFLRRIKDYEAVNQVFHEYVRDVPLARTCVQAGELRSPGDLEIDCIAAVSSAR